MYLLNIPESLCAPLINDSFDGKNLTNFVNTFLGNIYKYQDFSLIFIKYFIIARKISEKNYSFIGQKMIIELIGPNTHTNMPRIVDL